MFASFLVSAFATVGSAFRTRAALQIEILALRHQLTVLQRSQRGRVRLTSADRLFWVGLCRFWSRWRTALLIVKPETVIAWHQRGFRWYWRWKSRRGEPGRPTIGREVRQLISQMSLANPLWGDSVGINRRGAVNERVTQERRSEPSWPRAMRGQPRGRTRSVGQGHMQAG